MHHNGLSGSVKTACHEKSGSPVKCKNALVQSDCWIFNIWYLGNYWKYKVYFLHAVTYLLKLQIDDIISIYKEVIKTLRSQKLKEV